MVAISPLLTLCIMGKRFEYFVIVLFGFAAGLEHDNGRFDAINGLPEDAIGRFWGRTTIEGIEHVEAQLPGARTEQQGRDAILRRGRQLHISHAPNRLAICGDDLAIQEVADFECFSFHLLYPLPGIQRRMYCAIQRSERPT